MEYIGGFIDGVSELLNISNADDNLDSINTIPGWLHLPTTETLFGNNSFHPDNQKPFEHLLNHHANHEFSLELQQTWEHLTTSFQACNPSQNIQSYIHDNIASVGFSKTGGKASRITRSLSMELEEARYDKLHRDINTPGFFDNKHEKTVFNNVDKFSSQFLHSPCDDIGFLQDDQFAECYATYLGLPSPSIQHLEGQYIGVENDVRRVDKYGNQVAAQRWLSGGGHIQFHKTIQHAIHQIL